MTRSAKLALWFSFLIFGLVILGDSLSKNKQSLILRIKQSLILRIKQSLRSDELKQSFSLNKLSASKPLTSALNFSEEFSFNFEDTPLKKIVKESLKDQEGEFAVFIETLNSEKKEQFSLNEYKIYPSASLYKLFLMAAVYEAIEQGKFSEQTVLSTSEKHLIDVLGSREYGYEDYAKKDSDTIIHSVEQALYRVATISDNYAAIMLAEKVGWDNVSAQADKIGAKNTAIKSPITTTAFDIALFLRKLYAGGIVSKQSSEKIVKMLSESRLNSRIPRYLPKNIKIAHKTGELSAVRHDAGIVYLEDNPYLIVVMSKDLKGEDTGAEAIAELSGSIYEYFASQVKASPSPK